jgi:hypothetical protein
MNRQTKKQVGSHQRVVGRFGTKHEGGIRECNKASTSEAESLSSQKPLKEAWLREAQTHSIKHASKQGQAIANNNGYFLAQSITRKAGSPWNKFEGSDLAVAKIWQMPTISVLWSLSSFKSAEPSDY